ncbi:LysR family transcriptional regulator [Kluyvera genomosp. 1]|uniref:LysR family transcriptional regulator n=1 Tax=Kluyvera genomosp. 1 TaxID=2774053 RepID=UPI000691FA5D|nr:LysR family transcriptional regulator [Kluyvera genomosp. 1]
MTQRLNDIMISSITLFCLAAEHQSFTIAAQVAGISPAAVSKTIARLEERLGIVLFVRSTRQVRLTDAGRQYAAQCRAALALLQQAEQQATGKQEVPSGTVRISLPAAYAHWRLFPLIPQFQQRYPQVHLEFHISNRCVNFSRDDYDLAIRGSELADSSLIARKLEDAELAMVASPSYLRQHPPLKTVDCLAQHQCIQFVLPGSGRQAAWLVRRDGKQKEILPSGNLLCSEDYLGGLSLAKHGAGIYQIYRFVVANALDSNELQEVLPDINRATRPFYLIYPQLQHMPQRIRVFVEFMLENLRRD